MKDILKDIIVILWALVMSLLLTGALTKKK
jgi:hypothetical protein